jgi:transcriptional regulator with XRE-family HTH domain
MRFGEHVRRRRKEMRLGLREFCLQLGFDASNWSKIERGIAPPPGERETLDRIAEALGWKAGGEERRALLDLAAIDRGKLPEDILNDEKLMSTLPMFFRTFRGHCDASKS